MARSEGRLAMLAVCGLLGGCNELLELDRFRIADGGPVADARVDRDAATADASGIDANGTDAATDACSTEVCNGVDDDCDGERDEGFDLASDMNHCGGCGVVCNGAKCDGGTCLTVQEVGTGETHACALLSNHEVYCWGNNGLGQVGDGTTDRRSLMPTRVVDLPPVIHIDVGYGHSCAWTGGVGHLYCWGSNRYGELGIGSTDVDPHPRPVMVMSNVEDVAAGYSHTCVKNRFDDVYCWGDNEHGQLGVGHRDRLTAPPSQSSFKMSELFDASHTVCASLISELRCWGDNSGGQVGSGGAPIDSLTPAAVSIPQVVARAATGRSHTCAALVDGTAYCWGRNDYGELGNNTRALSQMPTQVVDLTSVDEIASGASSTCAIADGAVFCWGEDRYGQLADGAATIGGESLRPQRVPELVAQSIAGGWRSYCITTPEGRLACWGSGYGSTPRAIEF